MRYFLVFVIIFYGNWVAGLGSPRRGRGYSFLWYISYLMLILLPGLQIARESAAADFDWLTPICCIVPATALAILNLRQREPERWKSEMWRVLKGIR